MDDISSGEMREKAFMLGTVFKPSAPINREDLFAGRLSQIRDVVDAINQQGQHAVLYGKRGVGKTSLANMIFSAFDPRVQCRSRSDKLHDCG